MERLKDYKMCVIDLRDNIVAGMKKAGQNKEADRLFDETEIVLNRTHPSLMFYGLYNAGKSTLINAIFGENIASVGDVPTTKETQKLKWGAYQIVDTPGINAQNEHTLVAEREIDMNDVILFVVDDMNVEEKSFYSACVSVLKRKKPMLIVINEKNSDGVSLEESKKIQKLRDRIVENIRYECKNQGVVNFENRDEFYGIIAVNAMTALDSYALNEKDAVILYRDSGLDSLILQMQRILKSSEGARTLIPALSNMEETLNHTLVLFNKQIQNKYVQKYLGMKEQVLRQKDNLYCSLIMEGRNEILAYGDQLSAGAANGKQMDMTGHDILAKLNQIVHERLADAKLNLKEQIELYNIEICELQMPTETDSRNELGLEQKTDDKQIRDGKLDDIFNLIPSVVFNKDLLPNEAGWGKISDLVSEGISKSSILPPTILPDNPSLINIIIQGILLLFKQKKKEEEKKRAIMEQVEEANRRAEEQMNQVVSRIIEVNSKIRSEMQKLENSYEEAVRQVLDQIFQPILQLLESEYNDTQQAQKELSGYVDEINSQLHEVVKLRMDIIN